MSENKQIIPNFISGFGDNRYPEYDGSTLHNATIIKGSDTSRAPVALVQRDGIQTIISISGIKSAYYSLSINRQLIRVDNELRAYDLINTTSYNVIGVTLTSDSTRLYYQDTFTGVVVSDGILGWHIDTALNATLITGSNWQPISSIGFVDGYTLISIKGTRFFNHSELNDTLFNNGLFTYGVGGDIGNIGSLAVINQEVYLFCTKHTEIWYDQGTDVNAPFSKQQGRNIHAGIRSINTVVSNGIGFNACQSDTLISIYAWQSGNIQRIGCGALENELDVASSIRMLQWYENNIAYIGVLLNESTIPQLWTYNIDTQCWSTRDYVDQVVVDFIKFDDKYYLVTSTGVHLITGTSDNGNQINSTKRTSHIISNGFRVFHKLLELDIGGDTATLVLNISDDGGNSWKNTNYSTNSQVGAYNRYRFNRLGSSRDRVYELAWSSTNNAGIYAVYADMEVGTK